jgi:hypothetical protein
MIRPKNRLIIFDPTASVEYDLSSIPNVGDGSYLQVYYNDALVKTFSK